MARSRNRPNSLAETEKRELQRLTGRTYGDLLYEAWMREKGATKRDALQEIVYDHLQNEVIAAFENGELIAQGGKTVGKKRRVPDYQRQLAIATEVQQELLRGATSQNKAAERVAARYRLDVRHAKSYFRENRDAAFLTCAIDLAVAVEKARVGGRTLRDAVRAVGAKEHMSHSLVLCTYRQARSVLGASGIRAACSHSTGAT